jgi:hypothetical protein
MLILLQESSTLPSSVQKLDRLAQTLVALVVRSRNVRCCSGTIEAMASLCRGKT